MGRDDVKFAPVHLPADRALNGKASQTFLRHYNLCPRSGYLYALYKNSASSMHMVRGSALHRILELATGLAVDRGETYVPADVVKDVADAVFAEMHVAVEEHDYVREMAYRWAAETAFDPSAVVAVESMLWLDVDGWQVRMKVDYAELLEHGGAVVVRDYKSGRGLPAQDDVARKRPDGTLFAKSFQLVLYALGLAFGVPVRVEDGVETPEPFALAGRAQRFDLEYVYPGIEDRGTGLMGRRTASLTRTELHAYLESLRALLARAAHSEETGDWPAILSDEACDQCPAKRQCPIPRELRDYRGEINTEPEAREAMEVLERRQALDAALAREIKAFCKANDLDLRYGKDKVREFVPTFSEEIVDKGALWEAIRRASEFGEPLDRSAYVRERRGTSFRSRTLTADELAEERNGDG